MEGKDEDVDELFALTLLSFQLLPDVLGPHERQSVVIDPKGVLSCGALRRFPTTLNDVTSSSMLHIEPFKFGASRIFKLHSAVPNRDEYGLSALVWSTDLSS